MMCVLVVTGSIACQLEHLSGQILHHGSQVDGCASADTLSIVIIAQQTVNYSDRELQTSTG